MLMHSDRHLPYTQRPHTRCLPYTRPLTHSCLTHTHHTTHTRGALTRGVSLTHRALLPHGCSHTRAVSCVHVVSSACGAPFTHDMLGSTHSGTGSLPYTGSHPHSGLHSHSWLLAHNAFHLRYACVAARISPRSCTRTSTPHTPGHSRRGFASPQELPGSPYPPSSTCTCPQHSSPRLRKARPDPPGHDPLQGGTASPSVPEEGYPAARTGSQHALRALPHCPPLPPYVCVRH